MKRIHIIERDADETGDGGVLVSGGNATIDRKIQSIPGETIVIVNSLIVAELILIIGILVSIPVQRARRRRHSSKM
jgi:hypothetical protein